MQIYLGSGESLKWQPEQTQGPGFGLWRGLGRRWAWSVSTLFPPPPHDLHPKPGGYEGIHALYPFGLSSSRRKNVQTGIGAEIETSLSATLLGGFCSGSLFLVPVFRFNFFSLDDRSHKLFRELLIQPLGRVPGRLRGTSDNCELDHPAHSIA